MIIKGRGLLVSPRHRSFLFRNPRLSGSHIKSSISLPPSHNHSRHTCTGSCYSHNYPDKRIIRITRISARSNHIHASSGLRVGNGISPAPGRRNHRITVRSRSCRLLVILARLLPDSGISYITILIHASVPTGEYKSVLFRISGSCGLLLTLAIPFCSDK